MINTTDIEHTPSHILLVFVGHADDAKRQAEWVKEIESLLQKELTRRIEDRMCPFTTVDIYLWESHAPRQFGGQKLIDAAIDRANMAVFVFRDRVGDVTKEEFYRFKQIREEGIPIIAIFPEEPSSSEVYKNLEKSEAWTNLLRFRKELTENWTKPDAKPLTPIENYKDEAHFKNIIVDEFRNSLGLILKISNGTSSIHPPIESDVGNKQFLDHLTNVRAYDDGSVNNFRDGLKDQYKVQYPKQLTNSEFLSLAGFIEQSRLTRTGVLLFTEEPRRFIGTAMLKAAVWSGKTRSGQRGNHNDFFGSIQSQYEAAFDFIKASTESLEVVEEAQITSQVTYRYPMVCVRELLANALCHRDYEDMERFPQIQIYSDRIEIMSPGQWPGYQLDQKFWEQGLDKLGQFTILRNRKLATALSWISVSESLGSGIINSLEYCKEVGAPTPTVRYENGYVIVVIFPRSDWERLRENESIKYTKKHYTVFISSTFLDNETRRKLVEDAILRAGMMPIGIERFTASNQTTVEECQRLATECDIYLGIIAHRYGWIPDGQELSVTELEYEAAKAAGRPRLIFEVAPSLMVNAEKDFDAGNDRWLKQEKLDAFKAKYRADQMPAIFDESSLSLTVLKALLNWQKEQGLQADPSSSLDTEVENYLAVLEAMHRDIPMAGFKTKLRIPIDLEELYVPLRAMVDLRGTGDSHFADAIDAENVLRLQNAAEIPLIDAFKVAQSRKRHHLVILGDPGSGKTTHLKQLLLACLREGPGSLGLAQDTLPVFLPLRALKDVQQGITAFIEDTLSSPHLNLPEGFSKRLLQRGRLLLLFDGLDEVSDAKQRAMVARWIEEAVKVWPSCTAVVTCRFAGYDSASRLGADFLELHLRPMSVEQAEYFIRNWYKAVETGFIPGPSGEFSAIERANQLIERLHGPDFRSARMSEMTRNPLLLANLCLVHRDRGVLPRNRHALYDECIDVLLERWRESKYLVVSISVELGRRALEPVALWLHTQEGRTRASAEELAPLIEPILKAAQWKGGDAMQFLRTIRDESGLLVSWGHDQYGFMYLGFQEYLAASELRHLVLSQALQGSSSILSELAGHYGESWWQEVILLLLGFGNPSFFTPFMAEVLKQASFTENVEFFHMILEEASEITQLPFVELLQKAPDNNPILWKNQLLCLRVLERLAPDALKPLIVELSNHPFAPLRESALKKVIEFNNNNQNIPFIKNTTQENSKTL